MVRSVVLVVAAFVLLHLATVSGAVAEETVYTPVLLKPHQNPTPVQGADGLIYVVYELTAINASRQDAILDKLEIIDADKPDRVFQTIEGDDIKKCVSLTGTSSPTRTLKPSESATVFIFFTVASNSELPRALLHRLAVKEKNKEIPGLPDEDVSTSAEVTIDNMPVKVVKSPLQGKGWLAMNGLAPDSPHRKALITLNGDWYDSQRFAIDWIKLNDQGLSMVGDPKKCESYTAYGQKVFAAADGTVIESVDRLQNQIPGEVSVPSVKDIAGNHLVIDIGNNQACLYAHLKPGSVLVHEGDHITQGQQLALVGNTGNTTAPHLHFHVMNGKAPLVGNGLPFFIDSFQVQGKLKSTESFFDAEAKQEKQVIVDTNKGTHTNQLPLANDVVDLQ